MQGWLGFGLLEVVWHLGIGCCVIAADVLSLQQIPSPFPFKSQLCMSWDVLCAGHCANDLQVCPDGQLFPKNFKHRNSKMSKWRV